MKSTRTIDKIIKYYDSLKEDAGDHRDFKKMQKLEADVIHHFILKALMEGFPEEETMGADNLEKIRLEEFNTTLEAVAYVFGYNQAIIACRSHVERVLKGEKE